MDKLIVCALYFSSIVHIALCLVAYDCSDTTANITTIAIDKIRACSIEDESPAYKSQYV